MAKKEKTLLLALFDCFQSFANNMSFFSEKPEKKEYEQKLWTNRTENWYIVYCGNICTLCLGTTNQSDRVSVGFVADTIAQNVTGKNGATLRINIWPALSGKQFSKAATEQEKYLKHLIEKGVQLYHSNPKETRLGYKVWDADTLLPLSDLQIVIDQQYDYVLQLFLAEPYEILHDSENPTFFVELIDAKEQEKSEYTHAQIIALYTGALLLGLNISDDERIKKQINDKIQDYLKSHFDYASGERKDNPENDGKSKEKSSKKLKRFNLQTNLFFSEKKKSQNVIYIEEMIDKLVDAEKDDDVGVILEHIKSRIDAVVKDIMETAFVEGLNYKGFSAFSKDEHEEIQQLLRITDNRLRLRENDSLGNLKRTMTDALRIYIIIRFLQLSAAYGSLLLSQASHQIQKEASTIREGIKNINMNIDRCAELLEVKENELEKAMINVYGGNTV